MVQLLGRRRELAAWLLTAAAVVLLVSRVVALFAYPAVAGLRLNAVAVGPALAGVDLLVVAVSAALLAVAAEPTPKSRLIVLIDLLALAATAVAALVGLGLTLAAYGVAGIAGLVSAAVLAQAANILGLLVAVLVVRRALARTPRPSGPRPQASQFGPAPRFSPAPRFGPAPRYGPPRGYGPAPSPRVAPPAPPWDTDRDDRRPGGTDR